MLFKITFLFDLLSIATKSLISEEKYFVHNLSHLFVSVPAEELLSSGGLVRGTIGF